MARRQRLRCEGARRPAGRSRLGASAFIGFAAWALITAAACDEGSRPKSVPLAANRLYSGAPPTVPHPVLERGRQECLSCHLRGDATGDDGRTLAKRTPHPELENCVMCHVSTRARGAFRRSQFVGKGYAMGLREQPAGPFAIPHPLTMRENCLGCHDTPRSHPALQVTHPERQRCVQCHLPAHENWPGPRPNLRATPDAPAELQATWSL